MTYKDRTFCMARCRKYDHCPDDRALTEDDVRYLKSNYSEYIALSDMRNVCEHFDPIDDVTETVAEAFERIMKGV